MKSFIGCFLPILLASSLVWAMAPTPLRSRSDRLKVYFPELSAEQVEQLVQLGNRAPRIVTVAILDSGIDSDHQPELKSALSELPLFNYIEKGLPPVDNVGHGTEMAGIIHTIAPLARILPVRIASMDQVKASTNFNAPSNAVTNVRDFSKSLLDLRPLMIPIINASLHPFGYFKTMDHIFDHVATGADAPLVVVSAGNSSQNSDEIKSSAWPYPQNNLLVVGAYDEQKGLATFSNYGVQSIHLGAPGVRLPTYALGGGETDQTGTSGATAVMSGVSALIQSYSASPLKASQLRDRIFEKYAKSGGTLSTSFKHGGLDMKRVVNDLSQSSP